MILVTMLESEAHVRSPASGGPRPPCHSHSPAVAPNRKARRLHRWGAPGPVRPYGHRYQPCERGCLVVRVTLRGRRIGYLIGSVMGATAPACAGAR